MGCDVKKEPLNNYECKTNQELIEIARAENNALACHMASRINILTVNWSQSESRQSECAKALRELNNSICYGLFNALSAKEINDQPCYVAILKASNHADKLLKHINPTTH